jgi:hypothetical protein
MNKAPFKLIVSRTEDNARLHLLILTDTEVLLNLANAAQAQDLAGHVIDLGKDSDTGIESILLEVKSSGTPNGKTAYFREVAQHADRIVHVDTL